jgi:hypothetical protein
MNTQASAPLQSTLSGRFEQARPIARPRSSGVILALAAAMGLAACAPASQPGERSRRDGACPAEENCSDRAPKGLWFQGPRRFGHELHLFTPTAVGGRQTLTALYADEPHRPYVGGFQARITDRAIFDVAASPPEVEVRALSAGKAMLRLLDVDTDKLLDRIEIEAAPVARMSLAPYDLPTSATRWALLLDARAPLGLMLHDKDNRLLADESTSVTSHGADVAREAWDRYSVSAQYAGQVSFAVRAGSAPFFETVQVVSEIKDIAADPPEIGATKALQVKSGMNPTSLCFTARSGDAMVAGAAWRFTPSTGVEASVKAPPEGLTSCALLRATAPGKGTLTVEASGFHKDFPLVVAP